MKNLVIISSVLAILVAYGFTQKTEYNIPSNIPDNDVLSISGETLYQKNCAVCHGAELKGNPPVFPSLIELGKRMDKSTVIELLNTGRNAMPTFTHISEQERQAIAGYLYGESTESKIVTAISPVENGKSVFVANCARCHKAEADDVEPPDQRNWGMQPAILGGIHDTYDIIDFKSILNAGPCYMPSFDDLSEQDKEDIYAYLKTLENNYSEENNYNSRGCVRSCRNHN
jgi:mono/diheme cytochrome c family protein